MSRATLLAGLNYIAANRVVLGATTLDLFAVLLGGATALLPVYARDVLKVGAHGFGILRSGPAIGAAAMAILLSRWQIHRHAGRWMFAGGGAFGDMPAVAAHPGNRTPGTILPRAGDAAQAGTVAPRSPCPSAAVVTI